MRLRARAMMRAEPGARATTTPASVDRGHAGVAAGPGDRIAGQRLPRPSRASTRRSSVSPTAIGRAPRIWSAATAPGTHRELRERRSRCRSAQDQVGARRERPRHPRQRLHGRDCRVARAQVTSAPDSVSPLAPEHDGPERRLAPARSGGMRRDGDRGDRRHARAPPAHGDHHAVTTGPVGSRTIGPGRDGAPAPGRSSGPPGRSSNRREDHTTAAPGTIRPPASLTSATSWTRAVRTQRDGSAGW